MVWKLRLLWYRLDKAAVAVGLLFGVVIGALVLAFSAASAQRDAQAAKLRAFHDRSLECLARNVYYEARGEPAPGQYAVAEVTMNRKASAGYPKTVCDVVYQREAFSWTTLGTLEAPGGEAWLRAVRVAEDVYYQRQPRTLEGDVTHFHATYVRPEWSNEKQRVARIGRHIFYR